MTLEGFYKGTAIGNPISFEIKKTPTVEFDVAPAETAVVGVPFVFKLKKCSEDVVFDVKVFHELHLILHPLFLS